MTDNPAIEHSVTHAHNLLDKLAQLVGQDRAATAVKWVDEVKQHLADAIKAAGEHIAEVTDPAVFAEIEQLKQALLNRDAGIETLNVEIDAQRQIIAKLNSEAPAPSPLAEVVEGDVVEEPERTVLEEGGIPLPGRNAPVVEPVEEF